MQKNNGDSFCVKQIFQNVVATEFAVVVQWLGQTGCKTTCAEYRIYKSRSTQNYLLWEEGTSVVPVPVQRLR